MSATSTAVTPLDAVSDLIVLEASYHRRRFRRSATLRAIAADLSQEVEAYLDDPGSLLPGQTREDLVAALPDGVGQRLLVRDGRLVAILTPSPDAPGFVRVVLVD